MTSGGGQSFRDERTAPLGDDLRDTEALSAAFPADLRESYDPVKTRVISQQAQEPERSETPHRSRDSIPLSRWRIGSLRAPDERAPGGDEAASFQLRQILGQGGFGEVWEALQGSLDRVVAIKRMREDLHRDKSGAEIEFFESLFRQEALAAAKLEHPNIVPVYDLGLDDAGHPMLAMKLVRGVPWDGVLEEDFSTLSVPDFLAKHIPILVSMANAVAYAHSRGLIHRDLKPSQVMIGEFGEVLLMDWGLAILADTDSPLMSAPSATSDIVPTPHTAANPAGTALYMAPEQTEPTAESIGTWTDVYLLGGTLYSLLTGAPPHMAETRQAVFYRARNGIVPKPELAAGGRDVPRELAGLAMAAMAPKPEDRTPSALKFVEALQDYLSGTSKRRESAALAEQVEVRLAKAGGDYREYSECASALSTARALWPENPRVPALADRTQAEFALAALGNRDLTLARVQAERVVNEKERGALLEKVQQAEERLHAQARQRRFALATVVLLLAALGLGGMKYTVDQRRERIAAEHARTEATDAQARSERLTDFMLKELSAELKPMGRIRLLDSVATSALDYYKSLPGSARSDSSLYQQALAFETIGNVFSGEGRSEEALNALSTSLALRRELSGGDPGNPSKRQAVSRSLSDIAAVRLLHGDLPGALNDAREAVSVAEELLEEDAANPLWSARLASACIGLGSVHHEQGEFTAALEEFDKATAILDKLLAADAGSEAFLTDLAKAHFRAGQSLQAMGQIGNALERLEESRGLRERVADSEPGNRTRQDELARALSALVLAHRTAKDLKSALTTNSRVLEIREQLASHDALNLEWQRDYAAALNIQGMLLYNSREPEAALEMLRKVLPVRERLVIQDPDNLTWLRDLSVTHNTIARILLEAGRNDEALAEYRSDLAIAEKLAQRDPTNARWRHDLAASHQNLGELLVGMDRKEEALASLRAARDIFGELAPKTPGQIEGFNDLAWDHVLIGRVLDGQAHHDEAVGEWKAAAGALESFVADPAKVDANVLDTYFQALIHLDRFDQAEPVAKAMKAAGWSDPAFEALCKERGWE